MTTITLDNGAGDSVSANSGGNPVGGNTIIVGNGNNDLVSATLSGVQM